MSCESKKMCREIHLLEINQRSASQERKRYSDGAFRIFIGPSDKMTFHILKALIIHAVYHQCR